MSKETIFEQLKRELSFIYDKEITLQTDFVEDLNMDSLDMVEFVGDLESRFNFNCDNFDSNPETVGELVEEIYRQKARGK